MRGAEAGDSVPVIVEVMLQETGTWSSVEQAELAVQRALQAAYPDAPVRVATATMLPDFAIEGFERVLEGGPQGLADQMQQLASDPHMLEVMGQIMQAIGDSVSRPGDVRAPDDLSGMEEGGPKEP